MRMNGNEITIQRGEAFTIDRFITNPDGSPYIVPSGIYDARLVLRISSSKYQSDNRYVKEYIIKGFPRPKETNFINIKEIFNTETGNTPVYKNGFSDIDKLTPSSSPDLEGYYVAAGWYNGRYTYFTPGDVVFYQDIDDKRYYKWWPDHDSEGWEDYEFRLIIPFPSSDTINWIAQTYYWSLNAESYDGSDVRVLVPPTKLSVLSNLRGGN